MAATGTTQIPAHINRQYTGIGINATLTKLVHAAFGVPVPLKKNAGSVTGVFDMYNRPAAVVTPLTEGTPNSAKAVTRTDYTITCQPYGDWTDVSDEVTLQALDPVLMRVAKSLGETHGITYDSVVRDIMAASTNTMFPTASDATVYTELAAGDLPTQADIAAAVLSLRQNDVDPITEIISPTDGISTEPIGEAYVGIVHPTTVSILSGFDGWVPYRKYPDPSKAIKIGGRLVEVGMVEDVRFISTSNAKIITDGGSDDSDVYSALIFGKEAYATGQIEGEFFKFIYKALGSAGTADPLDQEQSVGIKSWYGATLTDSARLVNFQFVVNTTT